MFEYKETKCKCGQQARIVESGVGTYINCPYCGAGTYMCSSTEQALEKFKETGKKMTCESCYYYGKAADAPETVEEECMWVPSEENGEHRPCEEEE